MRPTLHAAHLTLRPFNVSDAPAVKELCSAYEIALNTLLIPHLVCFGILREEWTTARETE